MKRKLVLISVLLAVLVLSACTPTQPESNFPGEEAQPTIREQIIEEVVPIERNYEEVRERVTHEGSTFISRPSDEYDDSSSYNRIAGSTSFEVATQITLTYVAPERFEDVDVSLIIIDDASGEIVYEGTLLKGTHEYKVLLLADHAGFSPRFRVCYGGDVVCDQYRTDAVNNEFTTNLDNIGFNFERDVTQRQVFVSNDGNTHLTLFTYLPQGEDFEIDVDIPVLDLAPGVEGVLTFRAVGTRSIGDVDALIFGLADNCYPTKECAESAKVSEELTINFN